MRRLVPAGMVAFGLLALPTAASAAPGGSSQMATGGVGSAGAQPNNHVPFRVTFEAHGSPTANGNFTFRRADGTFSASVACYDETGNEAGFSGPITSGTGIFAGFEGQTAFVGVQDNGQGGKATGPDMVQIDIGDQYTGNCAPTVFPYAVSNGNLVVH